MQKNAFTILEVMLAIFILTVAAAGSFSLIQQIFVSSSLNKSKLIADYLAQEGIEIVRNIRDSNWLRQRSELGVSWKDGIGTGEWEVGFADTDLSPNFNRNLYIDSVNGFYSYSGNIPTGFKRKISISEQGRDILEVSAIVSWEERGRVHTVKVAERLYNWYGE